MTKTCTSGHSCQYRFQDSGTFGWGCNYTGYCDYQLPRDSRIFLPQKEEKKDE